MKRDHGISETVSVILIMVTVLILAIVIAGLVFGVNIIPQNPAYIAVDIQKIPVSGTEVISIFHRAGDAASLNMTDQQQYVLSFYVDTTSGSYRVQPPSGVDTFSPGTTLYIYNTSTDLYKITNNPADLVSAPPPISLTSVRVIDEKSHQLIAQWQRSTGEPSGSALSVTGITPASWWAGSTVIISSLDGTGFVSGSAPKLNRSGQSDIPATNITGVSPTKITCDFAIPAGTTTGPWNVVVTNTDGQSEMLVNGFTVNPPLPAPTVDSIAPTSGDRGWLVTITNLAGTGFQPGAIVKLVNSSAGPDIIATNVVINPAGTSLTGIFDLALAPAAKRSVTVTNPDGKTGIKINGFTVNSWAPTISKSMPSTGAQAATITITDLTGHYFQPGAIVVYSRDATSIPLTGVNVVNDASITGTLIIPSNAPTGPYSVTVTNTEGKTGTRADTFSVTSNAPILSNRAPTTGDRGWPLGITINGLRFQPGATVTMTSGLKSSPVTDVNVISTTQITCTLDLLGAYVPTDATTGYSTWNITVTNPDGKTATGTGWFSVFSFRPVPVSPLVPDTGSSGTTVSTSIPGTYFQPGATAYLYKSGQPNINAINVNVVSPTQITCDFPIPASASTGSWNIRVTNDDGRNNTKSNAFTVAV